MPVWEDAEVNVSTGAITLGGGSDIVRVLAPGFVLPGNTAQVGFGVQVVMGGGSGAGGGSEGEPIGLLLVLTKAA